MKKANLILSAILTVFLFSAAKAQTEMPPPDAADERPAATGNRRADLLRELGLSGEQMRQWRRINNERRPAMRAAQQRFKEATRALDRAVYADAIDEADVQTRIREAQAAQAEVVKIRTLTELAVRKILTAQQLTRFRDARRRFEAALEERRLENRENRRMNAPDRRFDNRRRQRNVQSPND